MFSFADDTTIDVILKLKKVTKEKEEYYEYVDQIITANYKNMKLRLDDVIEGNQQLNEQLNKVIEENVDLISADVLPLFREVIKNVFAENLKAVCNTYTINELFLPE